jgi:hypothetical protein
MLQTQRCEIISLFSIFQATLETFVALWIIYFTVKITENKKRHILHILSLMADICSDCAITAERIFPNKQSNGWTTVYFSS